MKPSSTGASVRLSCQQARLAQQQDDREDHRRRADDGRADQHRLGGRLERVAGRVVGFQVVLALLEVGLEAEVALDLFLDARDLLGLGQLEDRLGVVGHRAVAVDGDVDRPHAQEAERHQAEGEDRADADERLSLRSAAPCITLSRPCRLTKYAPAIRPGDQHALPEGAEVAGDDAGEDRQRRAAFARGGDDLVDVLRVRAGEDLGELGDQHRRQRAATDDRGQLPPQVRICDVAARSDR